ncbi:hypothetical protein ABH935_004221 [Catenulispora sp. GAS73]
MQNFSALSRLDHGRGASSAAAVSSPMGVGAMRTTGGANPGRTSQGRVAAIAAACAAALVVVGASGCSYLNDHHVENDATITQKVQALRIDNPAGQIVIHAGDTGGGIVVHRDIDYHTDQPPTPGQTITGGVLELTSGCDSCGIAYDVTVPASVAVTVVDHAGEVTVNGVSGAVDVIASAGHVEGDDLRAPKVRVQDSAGAVNLTFAAPPDDVTVHSKAGEVSVAVPNGAYAVDASSKAGARTVDVPDDPSASHHVTVSSDAGAVSVTSA